MIVISNTSPIIALAAIGQLDLLRQLYGQVIIPEAVYQELTVTPAAPGAAAAQLLGWIAVKAVVNHTVTTTLQTEVDEGEAEAIALALETQADLLLIDERRGRAVATRLGLQRVGLLGMLLEAKRRGFIPALRPVLDDLSAKATFWVSPQLYAQVLQAAGE